MDVKKRKAAEDLAASIARKVKARTDAARKDTRVEIEAKARKMPYPKSAWLSYKRLQRYIAENYEEDDKAVAWSAASSTAEQRSHSSAGSCTTSSVAVAASSAASSAASFVYRVPPVSKATLKLFTTKTGNANSQLQCRQIGW